MADAPDIAALAANVSALLGRRDLTLREQQDWGAGTPTGGPNGDGYYPLSDSTGFQRMVPAPATVAAVGGLRTGQYVA